MSNAQQRELANKALNTVMSNYIDIFGELKMECVYFLDCSWSMNEEFSNGNVSRTFLLIQELAKIIDGDGNLETIGYSALGKHTDVNTLTVDTEDVNGFVNKNYSAGGGTYLSGAFDKFVDKFDHQNPTLIFIITDGVFNDKLEVEERLNDFATKYPTKYINFIRLGKDAKLSDFIIEQAQKHPTVGCVDLPSLETSYEDFYKCVLSNELQSFLKKLYIENNKNNILK